MKLQRGQLLTTKVLNVHGSIVHMPARISWAHFDPSMDVWTK